MVSYGQFLREILRATAESNGDAEVIYPLLAANTDKLNDIFAKLLRHWATNTLVKAEADTATSIARVIGNFSNLIQQFPLGNKANNIEIAIAGYEIIALTVYTRSNFPQKWAATHNNLGGAYSQRILGNKAKNLERAVTAYSATLEVYTRSAFPQEWAMTQNNLAIAYSNRILGERAKNIELAVAALCVALEVYTHTAFPQEWAMTQYHLGNVYLEKILGDRTDNLERAIIAFTAALEVYTHTAFPQQWAMTQNNLGIVYFSRMLGNKAENIEQAIAAYSAALKVYTRSAFPNKWAMTQNNLGNAYLYRILGERTENVEQAIAAFSAALSVYTSSVFPYDWAKAQNNLGNAYKERILNNKAENIERAIAAYTAALEVCTYSDFPHDWVTMQNNLGNAYRNRILGERAENIELAIAAYSTALEVITRSAFPQNNPETPPETLFNLGSLYQENKQFDSAYNTFVVAIETVEALRGEIISGEESKRKQAEEWNQLYRRMVEVCCQLNKTTEAIEYAERSKTRNLVEQILERDAKTIFSADVVTQLETYRDEIAVGQYQIQNAKAENPQDLAKHLQELRRQRNELQNRYLPVAYGFDFNSFQATLNENTVVIEWYILSDKILAFIVTKTGEVTVWQSQPEDREALYIWKNQYLENYSNQKDQWRNSLESELKQLAAILHIDEIIAIINQLSKHCNQLILIPHQFLHLFPLHALPVNQNSENSSCLLDLFAGGVSYAPSCQLLQQVQQRKRPNFQSLFAIQNPTEDLNYTDLEVQVIQRYFNTSNILKKTAATLTAINNSDLNTYHCAHFSCHGYFNFINPSQSALILANAPVAETVPQTNTERYLNLRAGETHDLDKCLTLDKIFSLKLEKCRLVTLSACETGLIDFQNTSDEYIGLPSGFLLAGSKAVVSSLWTVSDLSTAFLMIKFYETLQTINSVSLALNQAQQWLRNLTTEEFEALLVKYHPQIEEIFAQLPQGKRRFARAILDNTRKRKPNPFAAPFYWAGFTATGL
ncbi:TPR repeat-containing protein [Tolypothrix tenuis PCC 7101]|uniref:TPR repeat-containing protein n=1 Tax=Tolypothrix tenuis PCC 7101 TaxID=231146 RepID=A0A1Z4N4T8_9CYAN|nr:CHAT domain-containing protein [Aulosira sp. FACHB-113]BAZ00701.1 TPR repeat-containing protein [Tolypothrix tenuis PCC 7101]BAZ75376.1 TPR repeat-containing protein [Aulosira laxa NIES-50]